MSGGTYSNVSETESISTEGQACVGKEPRWIRCRVTWELWRWSSRSLKFWCIQAPDKTVGPGRYYWILILWKPHNAQEEVLEEWTVNTIIEMNKLSMKAIPMAVTSALPFAPLLSVNESSGFHRGNEKTPFNIRSVPLLGVFQKLTEVLIQKWTRQ